MKFEISVGLNFLISHLYDKLPRRRVNMFAEQMYKHMCIKFQDHWYPEMPTKGSAYRSIRISQEKIDRVLINASIDVSLNLQEILDALPNDLTVWIDPGEVSYRIGEKGSINILYSNQNHRIKHDEFITNKNTPHHGMIFCLDSIESTNSIIQSSVISSWSNPVIPSLLPIQTFAQTRFGSLKIKHTERTIKLNIFR